MIEVTLIVMIVSVSIKNVPNRVPSYNAWVPYDSTTPIGFWFTYIHQNIAHAYGASINAAFDTLIPSMMIEICCQFSILQHRFGIPHDVIRSSSCHTIKFGERVEHHLQIYQLSIIFNYIFLLIVIIITLILFFIFSFFRWAKRCNNIFSEIIFLQYSISSIILCVSVYLLTQLEYNDPSFVSIIMYLICMLTEIFILCYSGSQVTAEVIFPFINLSIIF